MAASISLRFQLARLPAPPAAGRGGREPTRRQVHALCYSQSSAPSPDWALCSHVKERRPRLWEIERPVQGHTRPSRRVRV